MEQELFGPGHPVHKRIAWPSERWETWYPVTLPKFFIKHLACNEAVSPAESTSVVKFRETLSAEIQEQEAEVMQLRTKLADLESQLECTRKKTFACEVILSPVRRLPHDILYEIVLYLRPEAQPGGYGPGNPWHYLTEMAHNRLPLILSGVSKSWRDVIHDTPCLWQHIDLDYTFRNPQKLKILQSRINLSNRLSKGLPLTIHLDFSLRASEDRPSIGLEKVLNWLFRKWTNKSLKRVQRLSVRASKTRTFFETLFQFASDRIALPNVKIFLLCETERTEPNTSYELGLTDIRLISEVFPNLRHLWLGRQGRSSFFPSGSFSSLNMAQPSYMPLRNITTLFLQLVLGFEDWFSLLKTCPNLQVAWFILDDERPRFIDHLNTLPHGPIHVHPRLTQMILTLRDFTLLNILRPFINLRFPDLSTLRINFRSTTLLPFPDSPGLNNPSHFLQPELFLDTFPTLNTLIIGKEDTSFIPSGRRPVSNNIIFQNPEFNYSGVYALLLAVPSVTSLSVFTGRLQYLKSFMRFIGEAGESTLPHLRYLNMGLGLSGVVESIDELEHSLTTSLLGNNRPVDLLDLALKLHAELVEEKVDAEPGQIYESKDVDLKEGDRANRLTGMLIRCRLVGSKHPRIVGHDIAHRAMSSVSAHDGDDEDESLLCGMASRIERQLVSDHKMDIRFEVDTQSQDGLISDVPFDMPLEEWYLGCF